MGRVSSSLEPGLTEKGPTGARHSLRPVRSGVGARPTCGEGEGVVMPEGTEQR